MSSYITGTVIGGFSALSLRRHRGSLALAAYILVLAALDLIGAFVVRAWLPLAKNFVRAETCGRF